MSTEYSDISSSCEMKHEPAFKPLQGNPTLFLVRESRYPLHLRQKTQGPFHITIAEGSLLLRCFWKVGVPVQWNPGSQLSSQDDMGCMESSSSSCAEIGAPKDLRRVSQGISELPKGCQAFVVYDGEQGITLEPMHGNRA